MNTQILGFEECLRDRRSFELASMAAAKSIYLGDGTALCRVANRFKMYVPTADLSLAPHLMIDGFWESWITIAFYRLVRLTAPSKVVNVGANLGYYSFIAASLLPESTIVAYEPQPILVEFIRRSAIANGFNNLKVKQLALGSNSGLALLRTFGDFYGSAMVTSDASVNGVNSISVEISTLDLEESAPIEFLVIDAESFEFEILKGAELLLKNSNRVVAMLEFSASRYNDKHDFVDWMASQGFEAYRVLYDGKIKNIHLDDLHQAKDVIDLIIVRGFSSDFFDCLI